MSMTWRYIQALSNELRERAGGAAAGEQPAFPDAPADLRLLAEALATTRGPVTVGQWELGIGSADHARRLLDGLEPEDEDEEGPTATHLVIVANNAGGLVVIAGWNGAGRTSGAWSLDEAHFELLDTYRDLDDWLGAVVFDPAEQERDRGGLVAAIRARVAKMAAADAGE